MKFKLTPELSYVIGIYGQKKIDKGIGIKGNNDLLATFSKECINLKFAEPGKILYEKGKIYFYNSKLKRFFEKVLNEVEDRFIFANDYASNYFAGVFDAEGEIDKKTNSLYIGKYRIKEEVALQKLGFLGRKKGKKIVIENRRVEFLKFIRPRLKIKAKEVEEALKSLEKKRVS